MENPCTVLVCTTSGSKASAAARIALAAPGRYMSALWASSRFHTGCSRRVCGGYGQAGTVATTLLAVVAQCDRADLVAGRGEPVAEHLGVHLGAAQDVGRPEVRDEKDAHWVPPTWFVRL